MSIKSGEDYVWDISTVGSVHYCPPSMSYTTEHLVVNIFHLILHKISNFKIININNPHLKIFCLLMRKCDPIMGFFWACVHISSNNCIMNWSGTGQICLSFRWCSNVHGKSTNDIWETICSLLYFFFYRIHLSFVGEKSSEDELLSRAISSPTSVPPPSDHIGHPSFVFNLLFSLFFLTIFISDVN